MKPKPYLHQRASIASPGRRAIYVNSSCGGDHASSSACASGIGDIGHG